MNRYENKVLNLTQHKATIEQQEQGVIDLPEEVHNKIKELLTFNDLPNKKELTDRADRIYEAIVLEVLNIKAVPGYGYDDKLRKLNLSFMIGGAPYFMPHLEDELSYYGRLVYAFSKRVSEEITQPDGSIKKVNIFKHIGFVEAR